MSDALRLLRPCLALAALLAVGCDGEPPPFMFDAGADAAPAPMDAGEPEPLCDNGEQDGDESAVDCGGSCPPCVDGERCLMAEDCESMVCGRGYCLVPSCMDGVRNQDETGTDCGGSCGLCGGGQPCTANDQCLSGRCRAGMCTMSSCEDNDINGDETDIDCGGSLCPACAGEFNCLVPSDCLSLICAPTGTADERRCTDAACNDGVQNQDEVSLDCGGSLCPPCRDGLACLIDADCENLRCVDGGCVSCADRIRNADETDVDCGGAMCGPCRDQLMCATGADCQSGICEAGLCISCADGVNNGMETGIDCGGPDCGGCRDGQTCGGPTDCLSGVCAAGTCISCTDGVLNGSEIDVDCGGPDCTGCFDGQMCTSNGDCLLNRCESMSCTSCLDGVRNGAETAIDCGGPVCAGCGTGQACTGASDCASSVCSGGTCAAPTCTDGVINGGEVAVDCGGLCGACANGSACFGYGDCASNVCDAGTCRACATDADCLRGTCAAGVCPTTSAEDCSSAVPLHPGLNIIPWDATTNNYMPSIPSCQPTFATGVGPDLVFSFTATVNGPITFAATKPSSTRWTVVASTGACGTLTPEVGCLSDFSPTTLSLTITGAVGTTYYFYLRDTSSGTNPLSNPINVRITDGTPGFDDPPPGGGAPGASCTPGTGGVVGTTIARRTTSVTSLSEYYMAFDGGTPGWVYVGGTIDLWRMRPDGTGAEDVEAAAGITSTPLGYEMVIAGDDIIVIDTTTVGTSRRLTRISDDRGATWITGGEDYASFPVAPNDDFRAAAAADGLIYLLTHEPTLDTEVWIVPSGAGTVPVSAYRLGAIPFHNCTGMAMDDDYLYTACQTEGALVRISRTTLVAEALSSSGSIGTLHNDLVAHDTDADGVANVIYLNFQEESVDLACGLTTPRPARSELVSWGTGTSNYGLAFNPATSTLFAWDDDTRELLNIN